MELGEKLLRSRQEAGLSQRQLCGDRITRNMLSQIEHGTARPSMDTLKYLAARLGKPVSYFLNEDVVTSPNQQLIRQAREALAEGDIPKVRLLLELYKADDPVFQWEYQYLQAAATLSAAETARKEGKTRYARQLLEELPASDIPGIERQRLLLLGQMEDADLQQICRELPSLDDELMLRARGAIATGSWSRAAALLDAAENTGTPQWTLLRGQVYTVRKEFSKAIRCLKTAESSFPKETAALLEVCFRELGDYKTAYEYACKQR